MKQLFFLYLVLTGFYSFGQHLPFENKLGVKAVFVFQDCNNCKPTVRNKIVAKYIFDQYGNNSVLYIMDGEKPQSKQEFIYEDSKLISCQNRSTWVSTSTVGNFGMFWDSTILTTQEFYKYADDRLIEIQRIDGETMRTEFIKLFVYNSGGKLQEEITTYYPDPDWVGNFQPGTDTLIATPDANTITTKRKIYQYSINVITIQYFKDSVKTGIESIELDKAGKIAMEIMKDVNGNIRWKTIYNYNEKDLLLSKTSTNKGFDGYGPIMSDAVIFDKELQTYDLSGNLVSKKQFLNGKSYIEERYNYIY